MERIHTSQVVSSEVRRGIGAAAVLLSVPTTATPAPPDKPVSVGIVVGDPYHVGLMGEAEINHSLTAQLHGGTNFDDFSGGARLILKRSGVWEPYVGVGGAFETTFSEIQPVGVGSVGLRLGRDRVRMFVELNAQLREDDRIDEPTLSPGAAAGLLVELGSENDAREPATESGAKADSEEDPSVKQAAPSIAPRWGVAVGVPYTIAATYEHPLTPKLGVEGHFGSILAVSSIGARAIVGRSSRSGFYGFAGGGIWLSPILTSEYSDEYERDDSVVFPYGWVGGGGRVGDERFQVFAEAGMMFIEDAVASGPIPTIAGGIRF